MELKFDIDSAKTTKKLFFKTTQQIEELLLHKFGVVGPPIIISTGKGQTIGQ